MLSKCFKLDATNQSYYQDVYSTKLLYILPILRKTHDLSQSTLKKIIWVTYLNLKSS